MTIIRVVDLETTGLDAAEHGVCEIAYVDLVNAGDGVGWRVEPGVSEWLTNPGLPIPPETSAIHHIVDDDVSGSPSFEMVCNAIFSANRPSGPIVLAAHNARFERQWLTPARTSVLSWICTYKAAMRLWPEAPGHSNQVLRYWRKPVGLDRGAAAGAHRAGPDAYVTAFLLRDMLNSGVDVADLIRWTDEPVLQTRCTFGKNRGQLWSQIDEGFIRWCLGKDFDEDVIFTCNSELQRRARGGIR